VAQGSEGASGYERRGMSQPSSNMSQPLPRCFSLDYLWFGLRAGGGLPIYRESGIA